MPLEYLLKILGQLVRANILRSKRGPRGGFSLARAAKKISMLEIIEAVEGPLTGQLNLDENQIKGETLAPKIEKVYEKALAQAKAVLDKAKIGNMIQN